MKRKGTVPAALSAGGCWFPWQQGVREQAGPPGKVGRPWHKLPGTQQTLPMLGLSRKQLDSSRPTILLGESFHSPPGKCTGLT